MKNNKLIATVIMLATTTVINSFPVKSLARTTYEDVNNGWNQCVEYKDADKLDEYELVLSNATKEFKYAVLKYCADLKAKKIVVVAAIYDNDGHFLMVGSFDFNNSKSTIRLDKDENDFKILEIPERIYLTDYNAIFYDDSITLAELDLFVNKTLRRI